MMDVAYSFVRELVETTFQSLAGEGRVLHFAAQPRAHKLVQQDVEQNVPEDERRPAIQLYAPNKLALGDDVFDVWSGLAAICSSNPDELLELASDLDRTIEPYAGTPKMSGFVTSEYVDGPGYDVVLVRFRFQIRRE